MAGIKELLAKIESDAAFRETIQGAADKDELMDKIKAAGFDTTFEEFSKAVAAKSGELSDDELEGAAGGFSLADILWMAEQQEKSREKEEKWEA